MIAKLRGGYRNYIRIVNAQTFLNYVYKPFEKTA